MKYEFFVNEDVLIPQPDTEVLVMETYKKIIEIIKQKNCNEKVKVLDLCTGSGVIAICIKEKFDEQVQVYASDVSENALDVAKKNQLNILNGEKVNFLRSDMFEKINQKFDIIVSNPPYIKTKVIDELDKDVQYEPHIALDGGEDGLKFYRIIRNNIDQYLENNGYVIMEIGFDQKKEVTELFENAECIKDFAKNDRVIIWKK